MKELQVESSQSGMVTWSVTYIIKSMLLTNVGGDIPSQSGMT